MPLMLGKLPARHDARVSKLRTMTMLSPPPENANWYAAVGDWPMLGNDAVGDCVEAAVLHLIQQMSTYAEKPLMPVEAEALSFYSAATGYTPGNPSTDQGSYVMGPGGVMEHWLKNGVTCGGQITNVNAFLSLHHGDIGQLMEGVWYFGGVLTGIIVPKSLMEAEIVPEVWEDFSGPILGGHEILINGYETLPSGVVFDLISWGKRYRATQAFLEHCMDEAVIAVDEVSINARGVDGHGMDLTQLTADMQALA